MYKYKAKYKDHYGTEEIVILNDGTLLHAIIRGVRFSGQDFDALSIDTRDRLMESASTFVTNQGDLCACELSFDMNIDVCSGSCVETGKLTSNLTLGYPAGNGGIDKETISLTIDYSGGRYTTLGLSGWYEDELLELNRQMPDSASLKICFNCEYSDYSPVGHGLFGGLMCFRNIKSDYLKVKTKEDFWQIHDKFDRMVQETDLCLEFQQRSTGTGYRG